MSLTLVFGSFTFAAPQLFGQVAHAADFTVCAGCAYTTIQAAVTAANSGDTISVAAGTYAEVGQIVINKNLTIVGADKSTTIIKATANTGNSGDTKGWWLVNPGIVFNLSGVTLDGNGYQILQGIRHKGTGTIQNVHFTDIRYNQSGPDYAGFAIYAFGQVGAVNVNNSAFDNIGREGIAYWGIGTTGVYSYNTYTGKGLGNWLDYGVEVTNGAVVTIDGSTIINNRGTATSDGSDSAGIIVLQNSSSATITGNTVTGNTIGIKVGYNSPSSNAEANAHQNNISGNYAYDAAAGAGASFDATQNYWGSASPDFATIIFGTVNHNPYYIDSGLTTLSNLNDITSFTISGQTGVTVIDNTSHTVAITMPYGTDVSNLTPTITTTGLSISPASGVTYDFTAPQTYTVTPYDEEYVQLYIVTVTVSVIDPIEAAFNQISATLAGLGIANNLNDVTTDNITDFSGLYFEKSVLVNGVETKMGRITFNGSLDLSNDETIAFLQALGEKLDANTPGVIGLDFTGVSNLLALYGMSATIKFYGLDTLGFTDASTSDEVFTKITVLDDNGNIIDKTALVSGSGIYVGACSGGNTECYTFTVNVNHFTKFKIDNTAPIVTINKPSDVTIGTAATISGTVDDLTSTLQLAIGSNKYTLSSANISGTNWSYPLSTATLGAGTYTIKITAVDASGNTNYATTILGVNAPIVTGSAIQTNPELSLAVNNVAQTSTDNQEDKAILGSKATANVDNSGTKNKVATISSTSGGWIIFGLMWYWWLAIIAAIALIWWIIATAIHNNSDKL